MQVEEVTESPSKKLAQKRLVEVPNPGIIMLLSGWWEIGFRIGEITCRIGFCFLGCLWSFERVNYGLVFRFVLQH